MIGGNGGVQRDQPNGDRTTDHRMNTGNGGERGRSSMSGNGSASRAESNRGRSSMHAPRQQAHVQRTQSRPQRGGGGGGRRR
jgi:hypothetical protein